MRIPNPAHIALLAALAAVPGVSGAAEINVPADHPTITEAIGASEWGDIILVGPGTYKESIVLTEERGDGIILKSVDGPEVTTLAYGETPSANEAVITFQRCSNSTQVLGFSIDGRDIARRGILVNSNSQPVLSNLRIRGSEYGIASHRGSYPYIEETEIRGSRTAALFVQGGSADARDCVFSEGEKFGVYVRGTLDPMRLRGCRIENNGQVGLQATEGEFSVSDSRFANNGDSGMILQDVSPDLLGVTVENHANVGIVMEACWGVIDSCIVRNNEYGMVIAIEGEPEVYRSNFANNVSYHIGVEGDADPIIGGSLANANVFEGVPAYLMQSSSSQRVEATHNYWGQACAPKDLFQNTGTGRLIRKPWAAANLLREFNKCDAAKKYHQKWENGKLDAQGNPIGRTASLGTE